MDRAVEQAAADGPQVLLLGDPGAGKTALLRAWARLGQAGKERWTVQPWPLRSPQQGGWGPHAQEPIRQPTRFQTTEPSWEPTGGVTREPPRESARQPLGELTRESTGEPPGGPLPAASGATPRPAVHGSLTPTEPAVVSYLAEWAGPPGASPRRVWLHDCSGQAAARLVSLPPQRWTEDPTVRPLHAVLLQADALLLLVNAAADAVELRHAFARFRQFLTALMRVKAAAREVGGFPVYLVLTHADQLWQPGDTPTLWQSRLQQRSEAALAEFAEFLRYGPSLEEDSDRYLAAAETDRTAAGEVWVTDVAEEAEQTAAEPAFFPFGSLDLQVYATAIVPAGQVAEHPQPETGHARQGTEYPQPEAGQGAAEPYHVAELFRDVLPAAIAHYQRRQSTGRRLRWTVRGVALGWAAALAALLALWVAPPGPAEERLAEWIVAYREQEPPPEVRLAPSRIAATQASLERFRDHPEFLTLPFDLQTFVLQRLREVEDYRGLRRHYQRHAGPAACRTLDELKELEAALRDGTLAIPLGYDWAATELGLLRDKWLRDVAAIRRAEGELTDLYRDRVRRVMQLIVTQQFSGSWRQEVEQVLAVREPPGDWEEPLPGSPATEHPRGAAVTWFVPAHFERVLQWRDEWQRWQGRLEALLELADACGLTTASPRPPVLVWPEPDGRTDAAELAEQIDGQWRLHYPAAAAQPQRWNLQQFPDPARGVLRGHLERMLRVGGQHVRRLLQRQVGEEPWRTDTPAAWQAVADALESPTPSLAAWRQHLRRLAVAVESRRADPMRDQKVEPTGDPKWHPTNDPQLDLSVDPKVQPAADPVAEWVAFVRRKRWELQLSSVEVVLPLDVALEPPRPAGPLEVKWSGPDGQPVRLSLRPTGSNRSVPGGRAYAFVAESPQRGEYLAGAELTAELPLRAGTHELLLRWDQGSRTWGFTRLQEPPRLLHGDGRSEPARGVRLEVGLSSLWPRPPLLWEPLCR